MKNIIIYINFYFCLSLSNLFFYKDISENSQLSFQESSSFFNNNLVFFHFNIIIYILIIFTILSLFYYIFIIIDIDNYLFLLYNYNKFFFVFLLFTFLFVDSIYAMDDELSWVEDDPGICTGEAYYASCPGLLKVRLTNDFSEFIPDKGLTIFSKENPTIDLLKNSLHIPGRSFTSDFSVSFDINGKFDEILKNSDKPLTNLIINNKELEDDNDTIFVKKNKILFITKDNVIKYFKEDWSLFLSRAFLDKQLYENVKPTLTIVIDNDKWSWLYEIKNLFFNEKFYYYTNLNDCYFEELIFSSFTKIYVIISGSKIDFAIKVPYLGLYMSNVPGEKSYHFINTKEPFNGFGTFMLFRDHTNLHSSSKKDFSRNFIFEILPMEDFIIWFINFKSRTS